jgi:sugar lactone lactonase YvrE
MTISNGLAFSPDGRTMYHADTPAQVITAHDYDAATGTPSNARIFARFTDPGDRPDGAAVDSEGCYWTAQYRGGKLKRIAPDGRPSDRVSRCCEVPDDVRVRRSDLQTLYVTSARQEREAEELARLPLSGGLFSMRVNVPGLPEPSFAG